MNQQMKLVPRMIQSMEILQLPIMALEERIDEELAANPVLEKLDSPYDARPDNSTVAGMPVDAPPPAADDAAPAVDAPPDLTWEDGLFGNRIGKVNRGDDGRDPKMEAMANAAARSASLEEELLGQWNLLDLDEATMAAGRQLIDWVDEDGFIRDSLDVICRQLPPGVKRQDLERTIPILQKRLEPPGICARNMRECLLLQLQALAEEPGAPDLSIATDLVIHHLDDLEMNRLPNIARKSGYSVEQINRARAYMARHLTPRPGRLLVSAPVPAVTPDAIIEPDEQTGEYLIRLTDDRIPRLCINDVYTRMARTKAVDTKTRQFLSGNIRNARWLIDSIAQRRNTLLRVLRVVVDRQKEFIDLGPEHLKPLPMTGVADQLGIHVATVSRAVAEKYVQTPRGVFPLRQFFTGGMENASGESMSWDAVKARLLDLIEHEDKKQPLSDDDLVDKLKEQGITLARRTVAKYRKLCKIAPARRRREF